MIHYNQRKWKANSIIGAGLWRRVYDLGNGYVIKIARNDRGIQDNKKEVQLYLTCPKSLKKHLALIKGYGPGYRWIVMKKYRRKFPNSMKFELKLHRLSRQFQERSIIPNDIIRGSSGKPFFNNLRVNREGMIIVIDYANFKMHKH